MLVGGTDVQCYMNSDVLLLHQVWCKLRATSNDKACDGNSDTDFIPLVAMTGTLSSCPETH